MKYIIRVTKHSVSSRTFEVEADTQEEAEDMAFDEAFCGDGEWEDEETISHSIEIQNADELDLDSDE